MHSLRRARFLTLTACLLQPAGTAAASSWATPSGVWRKVPAITIDGERLTFPDRRPSGSGRGDSLEVTIRTTRDGATHVLRYQSPGCGEVLNLDTAEATLGCGSDRGLPTRPADLKVELTLDTFLEGQGYEHTKVELLDKGLAVCLAPSCTKPAGDALVLYAAADGHHLLLETSSPVAVESHQILFEVAAGRLGLDTSRRGGGVFRVDQRIHAEIDGDVTYRNGRLLFGESGASWTVAVERRLRANEGTELEVQLADSRASFTEVDGTFRRAQDPALQRRLDDVAPDPTTFGKEGPFWAMRELAAGAFKRTIRYLRPSGALVEVGRSERDLEAGAHLVRVTYARRAGDEESAGVADGEIEILGLSLDGQLFKAAVRAPCRDDGALATVNGYTFKDGPEGAAPLPDAGLIANGRILGRLRTDPWYSNLVVDGHGRTWVENAQSFFERQGFDPSIEHLIQGTTYLTRGRNVRTDGDNPEVNWRSGIGVSHDNEGSRIYVAHTLLPATNLEALTAYGRGVTQYEMAEFMRTLGATDALILDGGSAATFRLGETLVSGGLRELPLCVALERVHALP